MKDLDEIGLGPEGEGESSGAGPRRSQFYDPLFSAWDDDSDGFDSPDNARSPLTSPPSWLARRDAEDDFLSWDLPPMPREQYASAMPSWQPSLAYQPAYAPPLTDAQRRLRESVITIPQPGRRWWVSAREILETVLLALLIFLSVRASFQNFRVEGASMSPSLEDGEYLIVNKLSYAELDFSLFDFLPFYDSGDRPVKHLWGGPERGDVIVFQAPTSPNRDFIKRIIGVPGDTVQITSTSEVLVNGVRLDEPYAAGETTCPRADCQSGIVVPTAGSAESRDKCGSNACYFVMGDNRQNSSDSRQGWLVPEENIVGKALITYWKDGNLDLDLAPNQKVASADGTEPEDH
jgi:signal peptidase I